MHRMLAAGIAALGVAVQGTAAWPTASMLPASPRFSLSPGAYSLHIRIFEEYGAGDDAEPMKLSFRRGQVVLELKDDPEVRFVGADTPNVLTLRYGDGEDDVVLHGKLTADDRIEGEFVIEAYRFGIQHGAFTLIKASEEEAAQP